jgi:hypothetical protein
MTDEMNDASLNDRLWKDGGDRVGKALRSVDNGNEKVADAAVLQLVHDAHQNWPLRCSVQRPKISFVPSAGTPSAM